MSSNAGHQVLLFWKSKASAAWHPMFFCSL